MRGGSDPVLNFESGEGQPVLTVQALRRFAARDY
jgi:hypothetical protein